MSSHHHFKQTIPPTPISLPKRTPKAFICTPLSYQHDILPWLRRLVCVTVTYVNGKTMKRD
jgi:hypothetical protein